MKMKYIKRVASIVIAGTLIFMSGNMVAAVGTGETPLSDSQLQRIKTNCLDAQSTLSQLHVSDALLRVNRGQLYESIANKLMAPLNSRIVFSGFSAEKLISDTTSYNKHLASFRANYLAYGTAMDDIAKLDCQAQPEQFYRSVADVRHKRNRVYDEVKALKAGVAQYKTDVTDFANDFKATAQ